MQTKLINSIASISTILAILTILSKGLGLLREMIYAKNFGLSLQFDLFLVGSIIPVTINSVLLYLGQHYFVPEYSIRKSISESEGELFFNSSFNLFFISSFFIALLLYFFSTSIIGLFITKSDLADFKLTQNIFKLFLITIPFNAGISIISVYLQCKFNFIFPAMVQILMNTIVIILVFAFTDLYQIYILPLSFIISYILGFILLWVGVRKHFHFKNFNPKSLSFNTNQLKTITSLIIIEGLSLSYILTDRYYFEFLSEGGVSSLNYAMTIYVLPISIISLTLSTVIFPKFSQSVNVDNNDLLLNFGKAVFISIYLMMPITIIFIYMGKDFIRLFYERGKFIAAYSDMTQSVLSFYSLSLVFYALYIIIVKLFYSLSKYTIILYLSIAAFIIKIIMNHILVFTLKQNGLALSTSIVFFSLFITSAIITYKIFRLKVNFFYSRQILLYFISSIISLGFIILIFNIIPVSGIIKFSLALVTFCAVYIINSLIIKSDEYLLLKNTIQYIKSNCLFSRLMNKIKINK